MADPERRSSTRRLSPAPARLANKDEWRQGDQGGGLIGGRAKNKWASARPCESQALPMMSPNAPPMPFSKSSSRMGEAYDHWEV
jgi:hypothetical protein